MCTMYLNILTTLLIHFASYTFTYRPHFLHPSLHLPSPISHALHTIHIISFHTYNTYHILRPSNLHLSTLLSTPFASPTFTYLPHYPGTNASSLDLEINPCGRLGTRRRLYGYSGIIRCRTGSILHPLYNVW